MPSPKSGAFTAKHRASTIIAVLSTFLALESGSYVFLHVEQNRFAQFFQISIPELAEKLSNANLKHFWNCDTGFICAHSELGWWQPPNKVGKTGFGTITTDAEGSRAIPGVTGAPLIATYGDSFTEGIEVGDNATWQAFLSANHRYSVQNFGIMGFGPEQALLYFERNLAKGNHSPIAVLGLISESSNRLMNALRAFYTYPTIDTTLGFKPVLYAEGKSYQFRNLSPSNPLDRRELLQAIEAAEPYDDFFRLRTSRITFPFSLSALAFLRQRGLKPEFLWPGQTIEAHRRLSWIIDRFHDDAKANGIIPIVLLMPQNQEELAMNEVPGLDESFKFIRSQTARDLIVIDVVKEAKREFSGALPGHYRPYLNQTHPSEQGNKLIAGMFLRALCRSERILTNQKIFKLLCQPLE